MKLYATVTSERASKGQGGEWLEILISGADKKPIYQVDINADFFTVKYAGDVDYLLRLANDISAQDLIEKGEKQKGECWDCVRGKSKCQVHAD